MPFAKKSLVPLLTTLLCLTGVAQAETLVTFRFGGHLNDVDPSLAGAFEVGDPFSGTVTYDLDVPDQLPDNTSFGIYYNVVAFRYNINGTHRAFATSGRVNLPVGSVMDWLIDDSLTGDVAAGMTPKFVNIPLFENQSDPILTTDQMPVDPFPSMLAFGGAEFRVRFGPTSNENEVRGWITQDTGAVVPVERSSWGRIKAQYQRVVLQK